MQKGMTIKDFIAFVKLQRGWEDKTIKFKVEGYGSTIDDFGFFMTDDHIIISIAKPDDKDYELKIWEREVISE